MFDFGEYAQFYDEFYKTDFGKMIDKYEKALMDEMMREVPPGKALEIGCGTGHWTQYFAEKGNDIIGIDVSREMVEIAERKNIPSTVCLVHDVQNMPFRDDFFENIFAITSLEFVEDQDKAFAEIKRVIKDYGYLVVAVLNENSEYMQKRKDDPIFKEAKLFTPQKLFNYLKVFGEPKIKGCIYMIDDKILDLEKTRKELETLDINNAAFLVGVVRYDNFRKDKK